MGKPVSPSQALQILSVLALNTDWSQQDAAELQRLVVDNPIVAGAAFGAWLKGGLVAAKLPILALISAAAQGEIPGKATSGCFVSPWVNYRDGDIDGWLPAAQPAQEAGRIGVYQLQNPEGTTFREMAVSRLNVAPDTSDAELSRLLREHGHTFTLPAIEQLIERQERGEDVGLRTDGYANLAFVDDANGGVSVLSASRNDGRWVVNVRWLDDARRWNAELRLLLRNSDASTL